MKKSKLLNGLQGLLNAVEMDKKKKEYADVEGRLGGNENPELQCQECGGGGYIVENGSTPKCPVCGGTGMVMPQETQSYPAR